MDTFERLRRSKWLPLVVWVVVATCLLLAVLFPVLMLWYVGFLFSLVITVLITHGLSA